MASPAIGIDFGTTKSCVAVFQHGKVDIIPNDQGKGTTPSFVAFTGTARLIGEDAKNQLERNLINTVYDAKRLIGRLFEDTVVQADMKHWPFTVFNDGGKLSNYNIQISNKFNLFCLLLIGKPKIQVDYKGEKKTFFPEELCSMVLLKMKETAEAYLGKPVQK